MGTFHVIPKEIKEQILKRIKNDGISVLQAAKDADISDATIYAWLDRTANGQSVNSEVLRLQRELQGAYEVIGRLTAEIQTYKKRTEVGFELVVLKAIQEKESLKQSRSDS